MALGRAGAALAEPVTLNGITFSDELGGVVLRGGWGSGRLDDPFVLIEEITDARPAILAIRGLSTAFGNLIHSQHTTGFALTKIVRNRTNAAWPSFDLELREMLGAMSPYEDGLSFGQASRSGRPFVSTGYGAALETSEPFDAVSFSGGTVRPGETVVFTVVITDTTPRPVFYLLQKRESPIARAPKPPTSQGRWSPPALPGIAEVDDLDAAIDGRLGVGRVPQPGLAPAGRRQVLARDAKLADQILQDRPGPALRQALVVGLGADAVGVPGDQDIRLGERRVGERPTQLVQLASRRRRELVRVELEANGKIDRRSFRHQAPGLDDQLSGDFIGRLQGLFSLADGGRQGEHRGRENGSGKSNRSDCHVVPPDSTRRAHEATRGRVGEGAPSLSFSPCCHDAKSTTETQKPSVLITSP
jgi:hypothetical protein